MGYTVPPHCTCVGLWGYIMCGLYCTTSLHLCGFVVVCIVRVILYHLTTPVWVCGVHNVWVILYHLTAPVWVCGGI